MSDQDNDLDAADRVHGAISGFAVGAWTGFWGTGCNPLGALAIGSVGAVGGAIGGESKIWSALEDDTSNGPDLYIPGPYFND